MGDVGWAHHEITGTRARKDGRPASIHYTVLFYNDGKVLWDLDGFMNAYLADRKNFDMWLDIKKERRFLEAGSKTR